MLRVGVARVHEDKVERLRGWMAELGERMDEVKETFAPEGTRHEQVHLLSTSDGPLLVYVMEVEDVEASRQAFQASTLPIDQQHREVMAEVIAERVHTEVLLDAHAD